MIEVKLYTAKRTGRNAELKQIEPNGFNLLAQPTVLCLGGAIPRGTPPEQYSQQSKHAVETVSRITGVNGKGDIRLCTVINGIGEDMSNFKARRNNYLTGTTEPVPFEKYNYDFVKKFILPDPEPGHSENKEQWARRFSRLVISSFSSGGTEGADILNACRKRLEERGFNPKESKYILSHVKHISMADPTDMSFYESGATIYRILNTHDGLMQRDSENLRNINSWLSEGKIQRTNDIQLISTATYPDQHSVVLSRSPGSGDPSRRIAVTYKGNWFDEKKGPPHLNTIMDPSNHGYASYARHASSKHGFIGPFILQNLHLNAINHAYQSAHDDNAVLPVPDFDTMLMPPKEILFVQNTKNENRGLWPATSEIAEKMGHMERIQNGRVNLHYNEQSTATTGRS